MKEQILAEIRRTADARGGRPLGRRAFESETGIRYVDWYGRYWKSWSEALTEAGFQPNTAKRRTPDDEMLKPLAELTRELRRPPVTGDLLLKRRADPAFPNEKSYRRFGSRAELLQRLRRFCLETPGYEDVAALLPAASSPDHSASSRDSSPSVRGYVYLMKSGKHYKIGRSNSTGRREYELAIQLPERAKLVHQIATDDPEGIEAYWHARFASKRGNGEWFALDPADIAAFKRRKFQ